MVRKSIIERIALASLLAVSPCAKAQASTADMDTVQDKLTLEAQVLGRGEYRNGYSTLRRESTLPTGFVAERARLGVGLEYNKLSMKISAQHTGIWGQETLSNENETNQLNIDEAWARVNLPLGIYAQVGRQKIAYDDERILGSEDWEMGGRSHDALRLGYGIGGHKVEAIASFSQSVPKTIGGLYYKGVVPYKNLQSLWYHYDFDFIPLQLSALAVNQGIENGSVLSPHTGYMQTMGLWGKYAHKEFYGKAEFYYQTGKDDSQRNVSAYMAGARVGREDVVWDAELGVDYVSGSDGKDPNKNKTFNLLYGSTHEFLGAMDYFTSSSMIRSGVVDFTARGHYLPPVANLKVGAAYHYFITGSTHTKLHRFLGQEVDLDLNYEIVDDVTVSAGYSMMMPTSVMVFYKGGSNKCWQDWGWISLNVSPTYVSKAFKHLKKK